MFVYTTYVHVYMCIYIYECVVYMYIDVWRHIFGYHQPGNYCLEAKTPEASC